MNANLSSLFWEGFTVDSFTHSAPDALLITLRPDPGFAPSCRRCGCSDCAVHDVSVRRVRERDLLHWRVTLQLPVRRLRCFRCGIVTESISWLPERQRYTSSLATWVESLTRLLPVKHVAQLTGLHWHTIKNIDYRRMLRELREPERHTVRRLMLDEFALFKGHRYATVVVDADTQQVLWVGEGRSRVAFRPFFTWLGSEGCAAIESVAMDMNTALDLEVREQCPQAEVVYDLFHVVAKFGREVIDRVRVDQANQLRDNKKARKVIKRSRWLLLRNPENLPEGHEVKLAELLEANQPLNTVYVMKSALKELWYAPDKKVAQRRWNEWYRQSQESGIKALQQFAEKLKGYMSGIIASATHRLNTSVLEGMNNRIKVIKRMAYGYRDNDYFFMKIKAAFPGKAR
ncbi:ISL3 family transposase [Buttiauxella warmboldiae]|uniref:ISL3 family transposase n=2 Tax=Enterobacteriaceae TaxID=543 RepID=A0A3N5D0H5_9ENTR|nr:ISL3 family transposase [Buttiauxella warmboldiae]RPH20379.1 ISL3 family transposase [Buttiauxella warmboldiae]